MKTWQIAPTNMTSSTERAVRLTALYNFLFLGTVAAFFVAWPHPLVGLFSSDPDVLSVAADCLRIVSISFAFFAVGMVTVQAFNGAGDTVTPSIINFVCFWLIKIPLAYAFAIATGMGPHGVFVAVTIAYAIQTVTSVTLFRRGKWKTKRV